MNEKTSFYLFFFFVFYSVLWNRNLYQFYDCDHSTYEKNLKHELRNQLWIMYNSWESFRPLSICLNIQRFNDFYILLFILFYFFFATPCFTMYISGTWIWDSVRGYMEYMRQCDHQNYFLIINVNVETFLAEASFLKTLKIT